MINLPVCFHLSISAIAALWSSLIALKYMKAHSLDMNIVTGKQANADWIIPECTLHLHRFLVFTVMSLFVNSAFPIYSVQIIIFTIPLVYLCINQSKGTRMFRVHLTKCFDNNAPSMSNVLFADGLTSFARILPSFNSCLLGRLMSSRSKSDFVNVVLVAIPFWIRMRQCLGELIASKDARHLFNALKYATTFPVILLAYLSLPSPQVFSIPWKTMTIINSLFNVYWDLFFDWQLFHQQSHLPTRHLVSNVMFNLMIRTAWAARPFYGPMISNNAQLVLIVLEIMRRSSWLVMRIDGLQKSQHAVIKP